MMPNVLVRLHLAPELVCRAGGGAPVQCRCSALQLGRYDRRSVKEHVLELPASVDGPWAPSLTDDEVLAKLLELNPALSEDRPRRD
jgi:hypothetical protein